MSRRMSLPLITFPDQRYPHMILTPPTRKPDLINRRKRFKSQRMDGVGEQPTLRLMIDGQHLHPGVVARDCRAYVRKDTGDTARPPRALEVASDARQVALGREVTAKTCTPAWLPGSAGPLSESSLANQRDHRAMGRSPLCAVPCDGQHLHPGLVARVCGASERKLFGETARLLRAGSVGSWLSGLAGPMEETPLAEQQDHCAAGRSPRCAVICDG
ncbi:predicted protein [Postia placenta Mad-698-R]|uniref:Uncharacterized protein n=1 Tax=Postia placenta MAD-698-R-SB12 TaxID=670580 RepID=A0A1X6MWJ5_9APHY|nr:hypothetical protein POSPLADRAFT_1148647 [Postia placenta MAD-698-R-SB12]EED84389.1 predicted protein [Postia placenta Mad-698-R]OSX60612.1 hypothetical protein POSPLADRAFT_1148647 [Postia placenta MAD-698-R-SB12]